MTVYILGDRSRASLERDKGPGEGKKLEHRPSAAGARYAATGWSAATGCADTNPPVNSHGLR
jgi:hypothetical protein